MRNLGDSAVELLEKVMLRAKGKGADFGNKK